MSRRKQIVEDKKARGDDLIDEAQQRKLVVGIARIGKAATHRNDS
jgi:hypothetical protein